MTEVQAWNIDECTLTFVVFCMCSVPVNFNSSDYYQYAVGSFHGECNWGIKLCIFLPGGSLYNVSSIN